MASGELDIKFKHSAGNGRKPNFRAWWKNVREWSSDLKLHDCHATLGYKRLGIKWKQSLGITQTKLRFWHDTYEKTSKLPKSQTTLIYGHLWSTINNCMYQIFWNRVRKRGRKSWKIFHCLFATSAKTIYKKTWRAQRHDHKCRYIVW